MYALPVSTFAVHTIRLAAAELAGTAKLREAVVCPPRQLSIPMA
jgi:hypothetical protein